ncbi:MAG: hypothetical protein U0V02_17155 [Anaerolineales bacterium]
MPNVQTSVILKTVVERNGWEAPAWLTRWTLWTALSPIQKYFHSINVSLRWMKPHSRRLISPRRTRQHPSRAGSNCGAVG